MSELALQINPDAVEVDIYRVEPPKILIDKAGVITAIHAAYRDRETGEEVPVGAVVTQPEMGSYGGVEINGRIHGVEKGVVNRVSAVVRDTAIFSEVTSAGYRHTTFFGSKLRRASADQIATDTKNLKNEAVSRLFTHFDIDTEQKDQ
jgi:hypothetical protein